VHPRPIVGVIPAAGRGTRLAPLPCSKELLPVGVHEGPAALRGRPKVVSHDLLEQMRDAGAARVFFVVRPGKFDIAGYHGDGSTLGLHLAYLVMGEPWGPPFSIAQAVPFVGEATVLAGFPDILVQPRDAFARAVRRLDESGADVVLGVFPLARHDPVDLVERQPDGRITRLVPKEDRPRRGDHDLGYLFAAWTPAFTRFLASTTAALAAQARAGIHGAEPEWPLGSILAAALAAGIAVDSVLVDDGAFLDIGSPDGWAAAPAFVARWQRRDAGPGPA
jgi:glucose-1-phosphate thymidylyltransferase